MVLYLIRSLMSHGTHEDQNQQKRRQMSRDAHYIEASVTNPRQHVHLCSERKILPARRGLGSA